MDIDEIVISIHEYGIHNMNIMNMDLIIMAIQSLNETKSL